MAIETNGPSVNAEFNVETSRANQALQKFAKEAEVALANLAAMQREVQNALDGSAKKIQQSLNLISRSQSNALRSYSQGSRDSQQNAAYANRYIADNFTKTATAIEQQINKARADATIKAMRAGGAALQAKIKQEGDAIDRMIAKSTDDVRRATWTRFTYNQNKMTSQFNDPAYMDAKQRIDAYNRQQTITRANNINQYGQTTVPTQQRGLFDSVNERFNSNGGADIMAIQARLMAGYQVLNLFFSTLRNGSAFIVQLDAELKQFQAITNTSTSEMSGFKDQLVAVAQQSKFTAVELAKAATTMGQAGLSAKEVGDTLGAVATLAAGSGSDLASAVDVVTSTMSIFNLRTSEAADLANTLTASLNLSKLSIDKIALSMQYAGNIAAESGVGYKELLSIIGTMSNSGIISGSTLGTGLRQLMIDIQNPTQKFKDALASVGLTEQDVSIRTKTLTGVLRTLHDAGFGTAQAFESFEVRAASAFAALDGNLDSITDMNEQLINSAAATEANARQMESLANKWTRLGSTAGVTLDKMFGGVLEMLKGIIDGITELLIKLNELGPLLKIIGTLFGAAFGMLAITQAIAAVRGIAIALGGMIGVVKGAEVAFFGLNLAMRANPILLIGTALIAAITGFSQLGGVVETSAEKIDRLTGEVNKFKGDVDATNKTIKGLNDTAQQLYAQRQALDDDPVLRKARIAEIVDAFKELSTEIDASTSSTEELINAVDRLTQKQLKIKQGQLELEAGAQKQVVDTQRDVIGEITGSQNTPQLLNALQGQRMNELAANPDFQQNLIDENWTAVAKAVSAKIKEVLPDEFDNLADQSMGLSNIDDINEIILKRDQLNKALSELPADASDDVRAAYQALLDTLNRLIPEQQKFNAEQAKLSNINKDLGKTEIMNSPQFNSLRSQANSLIQNSEAFQNATLSGKSTLNPDQKLEALNNYRSQLEAQIKEMTATAEAGGKEVLESFKANILPAMNNQITILNQLVSQRSEDYLKRIEREMKRGDSLAGTKISGLVARSSKAITQEQVEVLMNEVIAITNARREALKKLFGEKIEYAKTDAEKEQLRDELVDRLNEMSANETNVLTQMLNRVDAIDEEQLRALKTNLDDQIQAITTKINENVEALKKLNPGAAFDKLKASTQLLIDQLATLSQQSNITGLQLSNPAMFSGQYKATTISGDQQNRTIAVMNELMSGYTDQSGTQYGGFSREQASGILGHLMQESSVRANGPSGDGGLANGLAQWHPDRYAWIQNFIAKNGLQNDEIGQARALMAELQTNYPKVLEQLKAATTPEEATRAFAGFEGFKDWNKPTLHAAQEYTARTNNALGAYSIDASKLASIGAQQTNLDQASNPGVARVTDAIVSAAEDQLKTQLQQAKIGGDPQKILAMKDTIDKEYDDIIKQRTEEFKKVNGRDPTEADTEFQSQMKELNSEQLAKTSTLIDNYWSAVQQKGEDAVKLAQLKLDEAQKPENANKYTGDEIAKLQADVTNAQKIAQQQQLAAATQLAARANQEAAAAAAQYGQNSEQVRYWTEQEAQAKQKVTEITNQKNAADAATAKQGPSVAQAIQNANQQWAIQNGLMQRTATGAMQMVPLATQVGNKWGEVLTGMSDNLATLFTNLASGTMSAKEAFKQFALSTVQMFLQMIAKALAYQLIMSTLGKVGSGGGLLTGLLGVPGMQLGGIVGVKGAAVGEMISGGTPNRDSVLRKLEPGEAVLRKSAVQQLGRNNVRTINAMGNRRLSVDKNPFAEMGQKAEPAVTNVWVVSPDQQPQMGPNDIVAVVADNISRRGSLKKLIKSVQNGE